MDIVCILYYTYAMNFYIKLLLQVDYEMNLSGLKKNCQNIEFPLYNRKREISSG